MAEHLAEYAEPGPDGLVFPAPEGGYLRRSNFSRRSWVPATQAAGVEGLRLRDLRHSAATLVALRQLRLAALADVPDAFASTLEAELAFPAEVWRRRAQGGPASANFIAREGGVDVGLAAVFAEPDAPGRMHLVSMWVAPGYRRQGVARALVDQAVRWTAERQAREVILWVADHNTAARRLYERIGFRPTGERQPLPSNPALTESLLRLPLAGSLPAPGQEEGS